MPPAIDIDKLRIAIIGGGPAGLMAAEVISLAGFKVHVYDAMPSVGRKFLMAGKGGLNITHSQEFADFISRYDPLDPKLEVCLRQFSPDDLVSWVHGLGIKTFVGSSRRVFPEEMKAAPLLRAWLHRLRQSRVAFHMRHRWLGWDQHDLQLLHFDAPQGLITVKPDACVLALGGASWPQLGSTGSWVDILAQSGVSIKSLKPSNCGFHVAWSNSLRERIAGQPLKSVAAKFDGITRQGDCIITEYGIEGNLIYTFSAALRDHISVNAAATLMLDLAPHIKPEQLLAQLAKPRGGDSLANHLRKRLHLDRVKQALLREVLTGEEIMDPNKICAIVKALPLTLISPRPIVEAISSAGGVDFTELDENLMVKSLPGIFCSGEMLDWEAPTGGYLLTGCFASGRMAGEGVLAWLNDKHKQ